MTQFIELINTVLVELGKKFECTKDNFKDKSFDIYKKAINEANKEICGLDEWSFMVREAIIAHEPGKHYVAIPKEISGTLQTVIYANNELEYTDDLDIICNGEMNYFGVAGNRLKLPMLYEYVEVKLHYVTMNNARTAKKQEVPEFKRMTDTSLIPEKFAKTLIVYNACMKLDNSANHVRFTNWQSTYSGTLRSMNRELKVSTV